MLASGITILYGNLCAIPQRSLKRLLGYSSISNAGYMLLGVSAVNAAGSAAVLYYLAAMLFLSLDLHHWMLVGFTKTYDYLPIGGAHLSEAFAMDMIGRTSQTFGIALQLAAPVMAVSTAQSIV